MSIIFSLATNDEHGEDTRRVSAIQLDDAIDLHWEFIGREPRYSVTRTAEGYWLRLSRQRFKILGKNDWYGNWCWTAITMDIDEAGRFLNYLSTENRWHCEGGYCDLTDKYEQHNVTAKLLRDLEVENA
jgi:hypothetical protein